ncbi:MAG: LysR substrate-binding domain-containing protein [Burkholderiales bacterium]|nr:LysR substrate-binding domain-containing protein [Burkholderiales bacterium]
MKRLDQQLLDTLESVLRLGRFDRAAELVRLSRPMANVVLARLRRTFDDELLVRTANGMIELTARALQLPAPMRALLERIGEIFRASTGFEPAFCDDIFAIAASDYALAVLAPPLAARMAELAPRAALAFAPLPARLERRALESDGLDLALGAAVPRAQRVASQRLLDERFCCVVRKHHPRVQRRLGARQYAAEAHLVYGGGARATDAAAADPGSRRRVGMRVPNFLLVPEIVARTDLVATLPERFARLHAGRLGLAVLPAPVKLAGFSLWQAWHAARTDDAAHQWLRGLVCEVAAEL